jgi:ribosomal protein L11 methyltransferase
MLKPPYEKYDRVYVYHVDVPALSVEMEPDLIGSWREGETTVLFYHVEKDDYVQALCRKESCSIVYQADIDYRDWESGVDVGPFSVGELTVAPVWNKEPADIRLDPSVIFGNGFHPTTRLCLQTLEQLLSKYDGQIQSGYDLGCGTGLLAIAAAKLGVKQVTAFDENSLACEVAAANINRNQVGSVVSVKQQDLMVESPSTENVDLVMANLFHDLLEKLFNDQEFWKARFYIISGFFTAREEILLRHLVDIHGLHFLDRKHREKWGMWLIERR